MEIYKPANYNSVSPYLITTDSNRFIELLEKIFDAKKLRMIDRESGVLMHGELMIDGSVIMLAQSTDEFAATKSMMHVFVNDATETHNLALSLGCESLMTPQVSESDTDLRGGFSDFDGNQWWIGTQNQ